MEGAFYAQVHEGMEVLDTNGEKIGTFGETLGKYFEVDAGFLGTNKYYVPFTAITDVRDNAIYLNVRKNQIDDMGWHQRPEVTNTATTSR